MEVPARMYTVRSFGFFPLPADCIRDPVQQFAHGGDVAFAIGVGQKLTMPWGTSSASPSVVD